MSTQSNKPWDVRIPGSFQVKDLKGGRSLLKATEGPLMSKTTKGGENMAKQTMKIVGVNAVSIGNYVGTFYALLGVIVGIILASGSAFSVWLGEDGFNLFEGLGLGLSVGVLSIIIFPFIYFVIGWIQGAIFGLVFNVVTHYMGGIEIQTK